MRRLEDGQCDFCHAEQSVVVLPTIDYCICDPCLTKALEVLYPQYLKQPLKVNPNY